MIALAPIRRTMTAATLLIFSICVVTCLGMQPVAQGGHDCCPRQETESGSGQNCPQEASATACSLNSLDLPKSKSLETATVAVITPPSSLEPASAACEGFAPERAYYPDCLFLRNRVLRI